MVENCVDSELDTVVREFGYASEIFETLKSFGFTEPEIKAGIIPVSNDEEDCRYCIIPFPQGYTVCRTRYYEEYFGRYIGYIPDTDLLTSASSKIEDFTNMVVSLVDNCSDSYWLGPETQEAFRNLDKDGIRILKQRFQKISDMKGGNNYEEYC